MSALKAQRHDPLKPLGGEASSDQPVGGDASPGQSLVPEFSKQAVIVVIIDSKPTALQRYSLMVLERLYLLKHDIVLVQPRGLGYQRKRLRSIELDRKYFATPRARAALKISPFFYEKFRGYEYILEHDLDSLVFQNRLAFFCSLGRDYISAAWIPTTDRWPLAPFVGLGGLSLRKVSSFERVSRRITHSREHAHLIEEVVGRYAAEDVFWGRDAPRIDPAFKVCTLEESLRFCFNGSPDPYRPKVRRMPPFGCHGFGLSTCDFLFYNRFVALPIARKVAWSLLIIGILVRRDLVKLFSRTILGRKRAPDLIQLRGLLLQPDASRTAQGADSPIAA
jgi:hypothetical protein